MQQDQQANENLGSMMKPGFAGTDAQKVKQEIQKDVSEGSRCNDFPRGRSHARLKNHFKWFFNFMLQN